MKQFALDTPILKATVTIRWWPTTARELLRAGHSAHSVSRCLNWPVLAVRLAGVRL